MIEARELRIGNYVKHFENGIVLTVGRTVAFKTPTNTIRVNVDDLDPIPLTEEWLLKFGFSKNENRNVFENQVMLIYKQDGVFWFDLISDSVCIENVHQLQNLYFALKGKELTKAN